MKNMWFLFLLLIGYFLMSLPHLRRIIPVYRRRAASKQWPVTPGKVLEKGISLERGSRGGSAHNPWITYSYSVLGYEYRNTVSLGRRGKRSAERALAEVGETIDVRYNPQKLIENITPLERVSGNDILNVVLMWAIILLVLFSIYIGGGLGLGTPTPSTP